MADTWATRSRPTALRSIKVTEVQVKAGALRIVFMRPMNAIALHNITKRFGTHLAVDDLSLEVPTGSVYGFIGPNGSGKTTTIRMILHILLPDSGRIEVFGDRAHGAWHATK